MVKFASLSFAKDLNSGLQQIGKFAVQLGETNTMRDLQKPQHMSIKEKFFAMYLAHRAWMEKIRRRIERQENIPQDIDGQARKDLLDYGVLKGHREKGVYSLIIASQEMMEMFKDHAVVEEAKCNAPPSGRQMQVIAMIDEETTQVIPNAKLRGLLRDSTPPPPHSKCGQHRKEQAVIDG